MAVPADAAASQPVRPPSRSTAVTRVSALELRRGIVLSFLMRRSAQAVGVERVPYRYARSLSVCRVSS